MCISLVILFLSFATPQTYNSNNMTIIGTTGGFIYGIDTYSLEKKWAVNTGGPLLSAEQLSNPGQESLQYALFPSPDGSLVYTGTDGIKASATTAKALTANSPFVANGVLYTGEKIDRVVKIDLKTGNVVNRYGDPSIPASVIDNESVLLVGRTDFRIRAFDAISGLEHFNLSYGEVNSLDLKYEKVNMKNDMIYIGAPISVADTPKVDVEKKNVYGSGHEVSISYDCGAPIDDNFDEDANSFLFSISNGRHTMPLYLDSSPTFSLNAPSAFSEVHNGPVDSSHESGLVVEENSVDTRMAMALVSSSVNKMEKYNLVLHHKNFSMPFMDNLLREAPVTPLRAISSDENLALSTLTNSEYFPEKFDIHVVGTWSVLIFILVSILLRCSISSLSGMTLPVDGSSSASSLEIYHDKELGRGSNGTVVLEGLLEGKRSVAVKKMLSRFQKTVEREISLLSLSDGHPNVVRYFQSKREGDFHLLVLELCEMSLWHYVEMNGKSVSSGSCSANKHPLICIGSDTKAALSQIVNGIAHLHSKNIVHRDVKPHNILLSRRVQSSTSDICDRSSEFDIGDFFFKISDMGLSKQLSELGEQSYGSFSNSSHSSHAKGTIGWQPREHFQIRRDMMKASDDCSQNGSHGSSHDSCSNDSELYKIDVFGLGCVFYYVLCGGVHPFGAVHDRERNIIDGNYDLALLQNHPDAVDLISRMIDSDPTRRPTANEILAHPFFWNETMRLDFLNHLGERIQNPRGQKLLHHLELRKETAFGGKSLWNATLPSVLLDDLSKARKKYDFSKLSECLRMMRNKRRHTEELSVDVLNMITPDSKFNIFFLHDRWPKLLMYCIEVVCLHTSRSDPLFKKYCGMTGNMFTQVSTGSEKKVEVAHDKRIEFVRDNTAWRGSALFYETECRGWWRSTQTPGSSSRDTSHTLSGLPTCPLESKDIRALHSNRLRANPSYRSNICKLKEKCTRRAKGKCDFAHDPVELKQKRKYVF